jgi:hypothetical protein
MTVKGLPIWEETRCPTLRHCRRIELGVEMKSKPECAAFTEDRLLKICYAKDSANEAGMIRLPYCPLAIHRLIVD